MSSIRSHFRFACWIVALCVGVGILWAASLATAAEPNQQALARVFNVQDRNTNRVMAVDGVVGMGTGIDANGRLAIKVYTLRAGVAGVPAAIEGIPVVVDVSGPIVARQATDQVEAQAADPTQRFPRPVPTGVSTGHPDITAGTIGCRVFDAAGNVYALSNNHVYADENQATVGDLVLQPGPFDGGVVPTDAIGLLVDFQPIVFSPFANNVIDAAIAISTPQYLGNSTPADGGYGKPASWPVFYVYPGQQVMKYGRTTRLTMGQVDSVNATVIVQYGSGVARFVGQTVVTPGTFSDGGDSGSLVVDSTTRRPVGLLYAGSSTQTILNPFWPIVFRFGVWVDAR